jgi:hypothetical protein
MTTWLISLPAVFFVDFPLGILFCIILLFILRNTSPLKWLLLAIPSRIYTALSYLVIPLACRYLDSGGNLRYLRGWLQPPDMDELWGPDWAPAIAGLTKSQAVRMYLLRNPSQGFDSKLSAKVTMQTPIKTWWDKGDNYLHSCEGAFHFSYRLGLATGGMGWRLNNIVKGYPHPTMGQIVATPIRFHK